VAAASIGELLIISLEKAYRKLFSILMVAYWCVDRLAFLALDPKFP
jgi:hypothetical protein